MRTSGLEFDPFANHYPLTLFLISFLLQGTHPQAHPYSFMENIYISPLGCVCGQMLACCETVQRSHECQELQRKRSSV